MPIKGDNKKKNIWSGRPSLIRLLPYIYRRVEEEEKKICKLIKKLFWPISLLLLLLFLSDGCHVTWLASAIDPPTKKYCGRRGERIGTNGKIRREKSEKRKGKQLLHHQPTSQALKKLLSEEQIFFFLPQR